MEPHFLDHDLNFGSPGDTTIRPNQRLKKLGMRSAGVDYRWHSYVKNSDSEITNVTCESLFTALGQMAVQAIF